MTNINLKITNNTSLVQQVSLLGAINNPNSANNANNLYSFDLSTQNFTSVNSVTITYYTPQNLTPVSVTVDVIQSDIDGVVQALNTLNIGIFNYSGFVIYVSSDAYIYTNIIIGFPFVSTWETTNISGGSSASNQVSLPLFSGGSYNFIVNWGDGNTDTITAWNQAEVTHTYASSGTYTISIDGECKGFEFDGAGDVLKILSVASWGDFELIGNNGRQFRGCTNLDLTSVTDVLNFGTCTNCEYMFESYQFATINNIDSWDVSNVTSMTFMFNNSAFNQSLNSWDVSSVTNMSNMFESATSFNGNITSWDVSSVITMNNMFFSASAFNQNIGSWNTSNVTTMVNMFNGASAFNQNLNSWDVSSVTTMANMFFNASAFNQSLNSWNVTNVTNMSFMFLNSNSFNGNISSWNVISVTDMTQMFQGASAFNQNIGSWNVSNVGSMFGMFINAIAFNQNLNSWDVSGVTSMVAMFGGASSFDGNISSWNVSSVTNFSQMFSGASVFNQNIGSWNVGGALNMFGMFVNAFAFNQDIGSWDVSSVTNFSNFMQGKTFTDYSSANLDSIYNNWSLLALQPFINITFGTIKYTAGASAGKTILLSAPNNWIISDGGI
jgi:surface protein